MLGTDQIGNVRIFSTKVFTITFLLLLLLPSIEMAMSDGNGAEHQSLGENTSGTVFQEIPMDPQEPGTDHEPKEHSFNTEIRPSVTRESRQIISPRSIDLHVEMPLDTEKYRPGESAEPIGAFSVVDMDNRSFTELHRVDILSPGVRAFEPQINVPGPSRPSMSNDRAGWTITNHTYLNDTDIVLNENIVVQSGGNLTLNNVTIRFNCTYDGEYKIDVENGGSLWINGSHITAMDTRFEYDWWFRSGSRGKLYNCTVEECGYPNGGSFGILVRIDLLVIEKCLIRNNMVGICCLQSSPTIKDNIIEQNDRGVNCEGSSNPDIENNTISNNRQIGIHCGSSSPYIFNNNVSDNPTGVNCQDSTRPVILNNTITNNSQLGISCFASSPEIIGNTLSNNCRAMECQELSCPEIRENIVLHNDQGGIFCKGSSPEIMDNVISDSWRGINCQDMSNPTIENNHIRYNSVVGIFCEGSSPEIKGNTISENPKGIYCRVSSNSSIESNIINNNSEAGIYCEEASPSIRNNTIEYNSMIGILCLSFTSPSIMDNVILCNGRGVECQNTSGPIIRNNAISGNHDIGVSCGSASPSIKDNVISDNWRGINCQMFSRPAIERNTILYNDEAGILCHSSSPEISGNLISNNSRGINCQESSRPRIMDNAIFNNTEVGIACGSSSPYLENNCISYNFGGLCFQDSSNPTVLRNIISNNTEVGLFCFSSSSPVIVKNTISDNWRGVECGGLSNAMIENNVISRNGESGIFCSSSSSPSIQNNTMFQNSYGMTCNDSSNPVIENNTISGSGQCGLTCDSSSPTLVNSTISNSSRTTISLSNNSHPYSINTTFYRNGVKIADESSSVTVQWFVSIRVHFINGSGVPGALIEILDPSGRTAYSLDTDDNGSARYLNCTAYTINKIPGQDRTETRFCVPLDIYASRGEHIRYHELMLEENEDISLSIPDEAPFGSMRSPKGSGHFIATDDIRLDASSVIDGDGDVLIFTWTSDRDGIIYDGRESIIHSGLSAGTHVISLEVTDGFGGACTDIASITVLEPLRTEYSLDSERFSCEVSYGGDGTLLLDAVPSPEKPLKNAVGNSIRIEQIGAMIFDSLYIEISYKNIDLSRYEENTLELYYRKNGSREWTLCDGVMIEDRKREITLFNSYPYSSAVVDEEILLKITDRADHPLREGTPLDVLIDSGEVEFCLTADVINQPPAAVAESSKDIIKIGGTVQINAESSYDPDGDELTYWWDIDATHDSDGDGIRFNDADMPGPTISPVFHVPRVHTVSLWAYDGWDTGMDSIQIVVTDNHPPVAVAGKNIVVKAGESIEFNASGSYDIDGDELEFLWNFSGGDHSDGMTATHRFRGIGRFVVKLEVTDGAATTVDTLTVVVERTEDIEISDVDERRLVDDNYLWSAIIIVFAVLAIIIAVYLMRSRSGHKPKKGIILLLIIMIIISFIGKDLALTMGEPSRETEYEGDDILISNGIFWADKIIIMDGNIVVGSTGSLVLDNIVLKFNCSSPGQYGITVRKGGSLEVVNNSIITAMDPNNGYFFIFERGSKGILEHSTIEECVDSLQQGLTIETDDVIVANCTIRNNTVGLSCFGSSPTIRNNHFYRNEYGMNLIGFNAPCNALVIGNVISGCLLYGIWVYGHLAGPVISNNLVTHTQWVNQPSYAIKCVGDSHPVLSGNEISDNSNGIKCTFASPTLINCTITNSTEEDFNLTVCSDVVLIGSVFDRSKVHIRDSTLSTKNSLRVTCRDIHDTVISDARITITDGFSKETFLHTTDENGRIPPVHCTYQVMDENGIREYNTTVSAEKKGVTNATHVCLDTNKEIHIGLFQSLKDIPPVTLTEDIPLFGAWDLDDHFFDLKYDQSELFFSYSYLEHLTLKINDDHSVDIYPENNWHGTEEIAFFAENPDGNSMSATGLITVREVDDPLHIRSVPDVFGRENETILIELNVQEVDGDEVTFEIPDRFENNPRISVNRSGTNLTILWNADFYDSGCHVINVSVRDDNSSRIIPVNVTIENVNRPPPSLIFCPETCFQGDSVDFLSYDREFLTSSFDPDGDELAYAWYFGDTRAIETSPVATHIFEQAGNYSINLTVSDGMDVNTTTIDVTVKPMEILDDPDNGSLAASGLLAFKLNCTRDVFYVEYYLATELVGEDHSYPFEYNLTTSKYPDGEYMLVTKVHYYDDEGNKSVKYIVHDLRIDNGESRISVFTDPQNAVPVAAAASISIFILIFIYLKDFTMQYFEEFGRRGGLEDRLGRYVERSFDRDFSLEGSRYGVEDDKSEGDTARDRQEPHTGRMTKKGIYYYSLAVVTIIGIWLLKLEKKQALEKDDVGSPEDRLFSRRMISTMLLSILLIGTAFSLVEGCSGRNIMKFDLARFVKVLPVTMITVGIVVVFSDIIELLGARLNHIRSNFQIWRLGNILMFFSAIVLMAPFGLPSRVSNVGSKDISKRSEAMMAIAKAMSIALFLIPFYFILAYAPEGSILHLAGKMGASVVLMLYLYTMFPLWPFEGYDVLKWNRGAWVGCFAVGLGFFLLHSFEVLPIGFLSLFGCMGLILFELSMFSLYRGYREEKIRVGEDAAEEVREMKIGETVEVVEDSDGDLGNGEEDGTRPGMVKKRKVKLRRVRSIPKENGFSESTDEMPEKQESPRS